MKFREHRPRLGNNAIAAGTPPWVTSARTTSNAPPRRRRAGRGAWELQRKRAAGEGTLRRQGGGESARISGARTAGTGGRRGRCRVLGDRRRPCEGRDRQDHGLRDLLDEGSAGAQGAQPPDRGERRRTRFEGGVFQGRQDPSGRVEPRVDPAQKRRSEGRGGLRASGTLSEAAVSVPAAAAVEAGIDRVARRAVGRCGRLSKTADAAEIEVFDDCAGHRPEGVMLAVDPFARPVRSSLAQRLLDIEQDFVLRNRAAVVVHLSIGKSKIGF